jgi:two-component system, LytTR family, response regulator
MLRAIAIDDEPVALDVIRRHCRSISFIDLQAGFTDPHQAIAWLQKDQTDLLFLDIQMPDLSGLELLKTLQPRPLTIFTTAYSEHAVKGFELDAIDYLLKPFSEERFEKACQKALGLFEMKQAASGKQKYLYIKTGYEQVRVAVDDIVYVQSAGNYVSFMLNRQKILTRLTMAETEAMLPASAFVRIHRSYIVAKGHITKLEKGKVYCGDAGLPVGAGYAVSLEKIVKP